MGTSLPLQTDEPAAVPPQDQDFYRFHEKTYQRSSVTRRRDAIANEALSSSTGNSDMDADLRGYTRIGISLIRGNPR
jgi:hypothetical protein